MWSRAAQGLGERHFAAAGGFSRRQGVLVAALSAHRALVRRLRDQARRAHALAARRRDRRHARNPARRIDVFTLRARADRIEYRNDGRYADPRLQDRADADRAKQVHSRAVAAAHARSRHPARRAASRTFPRAHRSPSSSMSRCAASIRPAKCKPIKIKDGTPDDRRRSGAVEPAQQASSPSSTIPTTPYRSRERPMFMRRTPATTIISPACRNGRCPAMPTKPKATGRMSSRATSRPPSSSDQHDASDPARRPGCRPTPARARPTCWRSASSGCCSTASIRRKSSA